MSVPVISIFDEVATQFGDPGYSRITKEQLLGMYNYVVRDICSRVNAVRYSAYFDLEVDDQYSYPDEATQVVEVAASTDPSDPDTFLPLAEMQERNFRDRTRVGFSVSDVPEGYFPEPTIFHVWPRPQARIIRGGKLDYFAIADPELSWATGVLPFPNFMQNWLVDGMLIRLLYANKQDAEGDSAYARWERKENEYQGKLENRSADARPRLRLATAVRGMRNQV